MPRRPPLPPELAPAPQVVLVLDPATAAHLGRLLPRLEDLLDRTQGVDWEELKVSRPALLSLTDAGERLGIAQSTVYEMVRDGAFPVEVITFRGKRKVRAADIEDFANGRPVEMHECAGLEAGR